MKKDIVIFNLDGTLADINHRRHLVTGGKKRWDQFYDECDKDTPIDQTVELTRYYENAAMKDVYILSGRSQIVEGKTRKWLEDNYVCFTKLIMRPHLNYEPDQDLKFDWVQEIKDRVFCIFDDRPKVVKMWRDNGFFVFDVGGWE